MISCNNMFQTLVRLSAHYPEAGHNSKTLAVLAQDYSVALKDFSEDQIAASCRAYLKTGRFFPKVYDLTHILNSSLPPEDNGVLAIEEGATYKSELDREKHQLNFAAFNLLKDRKISEKTALEFFDQIKRGELTDISYLKKLAV